MFELTPGDALTTATLLITIGGGAALLRGTMKDLVSGVKALLIGLTEQNQNSAEIIKLLVQHGEGVSFLAKEAVAVELQEGKLTTVPLEKQSIFLDVSIAYLKNQPLSPPARAFLKSLKNLGTKKMRFQGMGALMAKMLAEER